MRIFLKEEPEASSLKSHRASQSSELVKGTQSAITLQHFITMLIFLFKSPTLLRSLHNALRGKVHVRGSKTVALGIAPWGVEQQRCMLIGTNVSILPTLTLL